MAYSYEDLLNIVATLRSEDGCPWDRAQTHMSLRPCMTEEAAEVNAGIRIYDSTGNYENLREELGDVLLQVVLHSQIAKEEGIFTIDDVVDEIAAKMIRRHPHVFGDAGELKPGEWDEIKSREKKEKAQIQTPLREIPLELPALTRAVKVLKKADKLYGEGESLEASAEKIKILAEKFKEYQNDLENPGMAQFMGEMLLCAANISRICKITPELILQDEIENIINYCENN